MDGRVVRKVGAVPLGQYVHTTQQSVRGIRLDSDLCQSSTHDKLQICSTACVVTQNERASYPTISLRIFVGIE